LVMGRVRMRKAPSSLPEGAFLLTCLDQISQYERAGRGLPLLAPAPALAVAPPR
jgi:hypothetical protein